MLNTLMKKRKKAKKGFTLAELVIVVAIIAILTGLAVMIFGNFTQTANEATFQANHRSAVSAVVMAVAENDGVANQDALDNVDNYIAGGIASLQDEPTDSTYVLSLNGTSDAIVVTSSFNGNTLTYTSN